MCFAVPAEEYEVNPILSRAMDRIFTLHADHEQNASTSTVRLASSSGANPFACIAAGIACLWGPAHGGANQACLEMLREIGTPDRIPEFIARAKDKNDPFRLMGFGHRVYKNFDPRAKVMKESADEVLDLLGIENNPTLQVAKELEKIALEDPISRRRSSIPTSISIPASSSTRWASRPRCSRRSSRWRRTVGWISQWKEMIADPALKIGRPRQLYTGETMRDYVEIPLNRRSDIEKPPDLGGFFVSNQDVAPGRSRDVSGLRTLRRQRPDPPHHGPHPVRPLRRQMLVEPQPPQLRRRVDLAHLLHRQPGIKRVQDRDQPAHDDRVAVALEIEPCAGPLALDPRPDPDLAGTAVHLRRRDLERVLQRRHRLAHVDHVAIAILPLVEKLERVGDLLEGFGGHHPLPRPRGLRRKPAEPDELVRWRPRGTHHVTEVAT
jgi:hypothetical protein